MFNKILRRKIQLTIIVSTLIFVALPGQSQAGFGQQVWIKYFNDSNSHELAYSAFLNTNALYVGGVGNSPWPDSKWALKKIDTAGNVVGQLTKDFSPHLDIIKSVAGDASGVYLAGHDSQLFGLYQSRFMVAKYALDGSTMLWEKNQRFHPTDPGNDFANKIIVDSSAAYVIGYNNYGFPAGNGLGQWYVEKRSLDNGSILKSVFHNDPTVSEQPHDIVMDDNYIYISGEACNAASSCGERIEKRSKSDLSLIWEKQFPFKMNFIVLDGKTFIDDSGLYIRKKSSPQKTLKLSLNDGSTLWEDSNIALVQLVKRPTETVLYVTTSVPREVARLRASDRSILDSFILPNIGSTYLWRDTEVDPTESFLYTVGFNYPGPADTQWVVRQVALKDQCSDGIDNDSDGRIDYNTDINLTDPGCTDASDDNEADDPQCFDRVDNVDPEDILVDLADPGCTNIQDDNETDPACAPINNFCGTAHGKSFPTAPATNLCTTAGASPIISTAGGWKWDCDGLCGGSGQPSCSATKAAGNKNWIEVAP